MNKDMKYLVEQTYRFNPADYEDEEDTIIDTNIIDDVIGEKYPVFKGSNEILSFLNTYEWHEYDYHNDYNWENERIKRLFAADAMRDSVLNNFYNLLKSLYGDVDQSSSLTSILHPFILRYNKLSTLIYKLYDNILHIYKTDDKGKLVKHFIIGKYSHGQGIGKKVLRFCIYQKNYSLVNAELPNNRFFDLPDIVAPDKLADLLEEYINNISKKSELITEDLLHFNPIEYNNDDNDLIDNDTINDIIYDSLPKFTGSEKLKKILMSFDWKEQKPSHYKDTDIIGLLYAKGCKNPIQRFLSFIGKYAKSGWVQYMDPSQWMSDEYKYSMIYAFSETKIGIVEHIGKENQFYGNSVIIEEVSSKKEGSTIILSSYKKTIGKPNHFMSIYAPIELYAYLRDFIKLYTDNHVNENLYDFDVTDYENDEEDLIDRLALKQLSKYMPKYNFEGADAILLMLNSLSWHETDGHEYDYITPNTKKSQLIVYQPIIKSTSTKFELGIPHSHNWILDMILYFDILKDVCWEKLNNKSERVLNNMPHTKIWILHRDGPDGAYSPTCDIGIMFAEHLGKNKEGRTCFITLSHPNYKWEDALLISFLGHRWDNINYCNRLIYAPIELIDMLSSFIRYITGNEVEINESVIKFNPANYSDESEGDIIDSTEIDNITYKNVFPGSIALIDILRKYDWSVMTNLDLLAEKAYSGIIAMNGNFSEMYNEIKECLLSLSNPNLDLNNCCSIIFDDLFSSFSKKIVIEERRGEGYSTEIPCVISPCINGDMCIKFLSDVDYNFGRHIRCDIRLIRLLKEFIKNYE